MNRIKSFTINHNLLMPGFYISREDGDVITYDLRTRKPNAGDYMDNATMHSLEHMFATYIRNSEMGNEVRLFTLDRWDVRPDFICWFVTAEVQKKCLP